MKTVPTTPLRPPNRLNIIRDLEDVMARLKGVSQILFDMGELRGDCGESLIVLAYVIKGEYGNLQKISIERED